jgi:hypothetical protein
VRKWSHLRLCRKRRRFVDYQAFLLEVVIPEALPRGVHTLALILDNGRTRAPKQLEGWLAGQVQARQWPLTIEVYPPATTGANRMSVRDTDVLDEIAQG